MALTEKLTAIAEAIRTQSGKTDLLTLDQMSGEIIDLQSLAFEVVGNPQPATPKESTIWVDTDDAITSWVFSAAQPEAAAGMVWVSIDTSSTRNFNALKENVVQVYPVFAKQYVSGEWVNKTAKIYKDGTWLDFSDGYLYKRGTFYNGTALLNTFTHGTPTLTYKENAINVLLNDYEFLYMYFPEPEDFTGKTKLIAKFYSYASYSAKDSSDATAGIRLAVSSAKSHNNNVALSKQQSLSASKEYTLEVNVSNLSGPYYVFLQFVRDNTGTVNVDIREVRLQ